MVVSSVSDFVHFVVLAAPVLSQSTILRNRELISQVKLVCARHADGDCDDDRYVSVCARGCCGGWFAAEVVSAEVGPAVTHDISGLSISAVCCHGVGALR